MVGSLQTVDYVSLGLHGIEKALDERMMIVLECELYWASEGIANDQSPQHSF